MANSRRALCLGLLVCLSAVTWAQLPVTDDSYVTSTNPTTNSGNSPSLVVQQSTNGITLIKFDLSPLQAAGVNTGAIEKAYLKLYTSAVTGQDESSVWSKQHVENSGQYRLDAQRRSRCCTLLWGRRGDLEQSLPAEIRWKRECRLVLHHRFQNVRQTFRVVSIIKTDAGTVKSGR